MKIINNVLIFRITALKTHLLKKNKTGKKFSYLNIYLLDYYKKSG